MRMLEQILRQHSLRLPTPKDRMLQAAILLHLHLPEMKVPIHLLVIRMRMYLHLQGMKAAIHLLQIKVGTMVATLAVTLEASTWAATPVS